MADASYQYVDPTRLAQFVRWSLIALIVVDVAGAAISGMDYLQLAGAGGGASEEFARAAVANEQRDSILALFQLTTLVLSGFLVLRWVYRANKNLHATTAAPMKFTPGWAVGWYFVPFAMLWKPYQAMREIWQLSLQSGDSGRLPWWWTFWIATNVSANFAFRMGLSSDTASEMTGYIADFVSAATDIGAAILLMRIVTRVSAAQLRLPFVSETFS